MGEREREREREINLPGTRPPPSRRATLRAHLLLPDNIRKYLRNELLQTPVRHHRRLILNLHLRLALGAVLVPAPLLAEVLEETRLAEGVEALSYRVRISEVTVAEAAAEVFVYAGRFECSGAVAVFVVVRNTMKVR